MSLEHQGYIDLFPPVGIPLVPESVCEGFFVKNICRTTSHLHLHIFTSARLHLHISAHLHICTSTSLLIFTSSHIDIYICTSTSLHICTSTSLIILTSAHLHLCSSSHLTSAHLHICTSTSSHLDICTSTSSHLHICTAHICVSCRSSFLPLLRRGRRRSTTKRNPVRRSCVSWARNAGEITQ